MDTRTDPRALAIAYIDAVGRKEFDRVGELLHPDVEFVTSGPPIRGLRDYVGALRRLAPIIVRNDVHTTIVNGNDVAIVTDFIRHTRRARYQPLNGSPRIQDGSGGHASSSIRNAGRLR